MPRPRSNKPKRNPLDGYKTYDPAVDGYGDEGQWRSAFRYRLGIDAAREAVGADSPLAILGVIFELGWTNDQKWNAIKSAWSKLAKKFHPDNQETGDAESFIKVQGAYEVLEDRKILGCL